MTSDRLDHYRAFQQLVADLGPAILHDNERALLLDAAEGMLLTGDEQTVVEMINQANDQLSRMGDAPREELIEALSLCGPAVVAVS